MPLSLFLRRPQVTGAIHPGDMCAVMGPSGAGKTTLLDIVSRRKTEGKVLGQARFDGAVPSVSLVKKDTAYIQQQDCFFGGATVREPIMFAAMAKLPKLSKRDRVSGVSVCCSDSEDVAEKRARVSDVITQTLTLCGITSKSWHGKFISGDGVSPSNGHTTVDIGS